MKQIVNKYGECGTIISMHTEIKYTTDELQTISNDLYRYSKIVADIRNSINNTRFTIFEIQKCVSYTMVALINGQVNTIHSAQNQITLLLTLK